MTGLSPSIFLPVIIFNFRLFFQASVVLHFARVQLILVAPSLIFRFRVGFFHILKIDLIELSWNGTGTALQLHWIGTDKEMLVPVGPALKTKNGSAIALILHFH